MRYSESAMPCAVDIVPKLNKCSAMSDIFWQAPHILDNICLQTMQISTPSSAEYYNISHTFSGQYVNREMADYWQVVNTGSELL